MCNTSENSYIANLKKKTDSNCEKSKHIRFKSNENKKTILMVISVAVMNFSVTSVTLRID